MAAPLLQQSVPSDDTTGVSVTSNIGLGFDQAVKAGSGYIRIYKSDGTLFHTIAITDTSQVTFLTTQPARVMINPNVNLVAGTGYYILIDVGAIENLGGEDYAGIASSATLNFTTAGTAPADTVAPLLSSTAPSDNAMGVAASSNLVLTFNEAVKAGTGNIEIRYVSDGSIARTIAVTDATQVSFSGSQMTINPTDDLAAGTGYYVTFASGVVRDLANNNFAGISSSTAFNFTTVDTTAPLLIGLLPGDDAANVPVAANLGLDFDQAIKAGTGNIEIRKLSDDSLVQAIAITDATQVSISGNHLAINPSTNLAGNTEYYVMFGSGIVLDLADNAFAGITSSTTFNFMTADTVPPVLVSTFPADNSSDVYPDDNLVLSFNETILIGSGNIEIRKSSDGSIVQTIAVTDGTQVERVGGASLVINPHTDLDDGTSYYVTFGSGVVEDLYGNAFPGISSPTTFNFSTVHLGTPGADTLTGDSGNNAFDGGIGLDNLSGGLGDDIYYINNYEGGETTILLQSEAGDWIGAGETLSLPVTGDYELYAFWGDANSDGLADSIRIHYDDNVNYWEFRFDTRRLGTNIVPGTYLDATHATRDDTPGHPGLEVSGNSRGAIEIFGSFTVTEAVFDHSDPNNPIVISLAISFEQHSEDPNAPALYGVLHYNYAAGGARTYDAIVENPGGGTDTVKAAVSYTLGTNLENLILTGLYDIDGTGNTLNNAITGNGQDNVLDGAGGADTMAGGDGDDTYIVDNAGDVIIENEGDGNDTVESSVAHALAANVENLTLTGSANINGTGNALDNILIGNTGTNVLTGLNGNDFYRPGTGDTVVEGLNGGTDTVEVSGTYTLGDNVENLILTGAANANGSGNALDNILTATNQLPATAAQNTLTGGAGNDTLNGGTGIDTLVGGLGDDTYVIENHEGGQTSILVVKEGTEDTPGDIWSYVPTTGLSVSVFDLTDGGEVSFVRIQYDNAGASWRLDFSTEQLGIALAPGTYADVERATFASPGHAGMDVSGMGSGGNTIFGSFTVTEAVFDYSNPSEPVVVSLSITFEQHADSPDAPAWTGVVNYDYAPAGPAALDTIVEGSNEGTDTIEASISYVLTSPNVENLTLTGDEEHLNGTGNSGNNVITGNGRNNVLDGGGGMDTLVGGEGDDTYVVNNAGVTIVEGPGVFGGGGTDLVQSSISRGLEAYVENLTLTGTANLDATGNSLGNLLTGNTGNNVIIGGLGDDGLVGGGGNDSFNIAPGDGIDFIYDFSAGAGVGDVIVLDGFAHNSFSAVQAAMTQNIFGHTILDLGNGQTLGFYNIQKTAFAADDFAFANVQPSGPEPFTLPVSGAFTNTISGSRRADNLNGTSANNRLDGRQGNDNMTGFSGDDTYLVDTSGDVVMEAWGQGIDTVISSASSYVLANNVENLTLTGTNNHTGTGNDLNNLIIASSRPDTINGGAGNDIIRAGTGACVLTGGTGNDIFAFPVAGAQKTVTDFHAGEDLVDLRSLLTWYGGSNPAGDGVIAVTATAGGVFIAVKATAGGSWQNLVKLTGVSVGDVDVAGDILWE